ncbi:MAG: DinB family protein [Lapillicoccus sp.]
MDIWEGRPRPPRAGTERETLDGWVDFHRDTLMRKCAGLTDEQLKTAAVPPSTLTLLGLVRHMTEVDRGWFLDYADGGYPGPLYATDADDDADWHGVPAADARADLARFLTETAAVREAVRDVSLDVVVSHPGQDISLRWAYTHMIEEYARHNGHADLLREAIDGTVGD